MQLPLPRMALLIAVDTYRIVLYCTTNNRTMQLIQRDCVGRRFVLDAHNNNAVALPWMSCFVDCCGCVQDGTLSHNKQKECNRFEGIALNVNLYRMLTTTMQLPRLACLALLIAEDTYRMVPYCTANNRTMQSIWRDRFVDSYRMLTTTMPSPRLKCLALFPLHTTYRMVSYCTTNNRTMLQLRMRSESEILSKFQMQHKNRGKPVPSRPKYKHRQYNHKNMYHHTGLHF